MTGILLSTGKEINKFLSPRTDKDCHTEFLGLVHKWTFIPPFYLFAL